MNYSNYFNNHPTQQLTTMGHLLGALETSINTPLGLISIDTPYGKASLANIIGVDMPIFTQPIVAKQAFVMAAGRGIRMGPRTRNQPKALIEVGEHDKPLIDHNLDLLNAVGVERTFVTINYLGEQIKAHLSQKNNLSQQEYITISQKLLSAPRVIAHSMLSPSYISNADTIFVPSEGDNTNPYLRLAEEHYRSDNIATLLLCHRDNAIGYEGNGDYNLDEKNLIWHSPDRDDKSDYVYTGTMLVSRSFPLRLLNAFTRYALDKRSSKKTSAEASAVDSSVAHQVLGGMADPNTSIIKRWGAAIYDGALYDVSDPEMLTEASLRISKLTI